MLKRVALDLQDQAGKLNRNADEQDKASSGASDSGAPGKPDSNPPGDPGPLNPDLPDVDVRGDVRDDPAAGNPRDIQQGQIGDCWLLAGLGSVAQTLDREGKLDEFLATHMRPVGDPPAHWVVTLYEDGKPVEVTVEAKSTPGGVRGADGQPNWLSIYERAAAEHRGGSYNDINGGFSNDAMELMTGKSADRDGELSLDELEDKLANGEAVSVGTEDVKDEDFDWFWESDEVNRTDVVPNHAYIVVDVKTNDSGEKIVVLANPWGPSGGDLDGEHKSGTLELTEEEYKENFDSVYSMDVK
ncbi:C2 family cysteine protease [Arthrobacter sp. CJ23]|uniref:C2 family cysteine protease n=1 Tax=Arthrobacter sp. CJ23 TaxID=2972479 RepID=UPI00215C4A74|nr:C2 family cysteine protease [Arthrobacter sp. CJ23]UVJ39061.1 C2 family cysteine protease [Arthrobacter sp. CJ23]